MPKRKATAAQLRNLAKGRKKLAAMRRAGTVRRKKMTKKTTRRARPRRKNPDISDEAYELILYAENTESLYSQQQSIVKNLIRKMNRGVYDPKRAPALWKYWMDNAAKGYTREHGTGRGYGIFTPTIRREAAAYMATQEFDSIMAGDYEDLLALKKKNPAYGNFQTARNVLRTGRTTNPKRPSYRGGIPPGTRGRALHHVIASIDPRSGRTVWWGAFGWGPDKKAVTFSDVKNAKYAAGKMKRPVVIAKEFTSAHELGKVLRGEK